MITNLFSLLNTNWFIDPSMKNSLLPQLRNVLEGKMIEGTASYPLVYTSSSTILGSKDSPTPSSEDNYVAVIPIKGGIYKYNQFCGPTGTKTIARTIQAYDRDVNCIGIVLDIDSGGGQVSGTAEFYDVITSIATPIETYTDGYLCSAAYYIASATNKITANKRADKIGSIGAMTYFIDLEGYYKAQGANVIEEYATKSTDKNKTVRDLISGNPEPYIKQELDPIVEDFIADVKAKRSNIKEEVFTGGTYGPSKSIAMGLVDQLGTLKEVVNNLLTPANKNKQKESNSMSKITLTALCAALAVESLASTDKGTYLNEEQLNALNSALEGSNAKAEELASDLASEQGDSAKASNNLTDLLKVAGIEATESSEENFAALTEKFNELNAKPGNAHTGAKGNTVPPTEQPDSFVDMEASHNKLANQINH